MATHCRVAYLSGGLWRCPVVSLYVRIFAANVKAWCIEVRLLAIWWSACTCMWQTMPGQELLLPMRHTEKHREKITKHLFPHRKGVQFEVDCLARLKMPQPFSKTVQVLQVPALNIQNPRYTHDCMHQGDQATLATDLPRGERTATQAA